MKVENAVYPGPENLKELAAEAAAGPIAMVNLLKFRDRAVYKDGRPDGISGVEAYMRYATECERSSSGPADDFCSAAGSRAWWSEKSRTFGT